jgi:ubiquinone/menaquinone biosynthesis C-methylase UbiE
VSDYDGYIRAEWDLFHGNPTRTQASLEAVAGVKIDRVLDIGCGAGQELLPFVGGYPTLGVGLDHSPTVGHVGRQLLANQRLSGRVAFVRGLAEALPCISGSFDLIVCRLALPYTHNAQALSEMARVLRPGGLVLLKFHHARFYLERMTRAVASCDVRGLMYATRVLIAGTVYHVTGRQPRNPVLGRETFQTTTLLRRELRRCGLTIRNEMGGATPRTPAIVLVKES